LRRSLARTRLIAVGYGDGGVHRGRTERPSLLAGGKLGFGLLQPPRSSVYPALCPFQPAVRPLQPRFGPFNPPLGSFLLENKP
jgi:hypothetical protein